MNGEKELARLPETDAIRLGASMGEIIQATEMIKGKKITSVKVKESEEK